MLINVYSVSLLLVVCSWIITVASPQVRAASSSNNDYHSVINPSQDDAVAIVVGAGPAGLATSLALSKVCRKVCLVEKHESFARRGATFGLARNGQLALQTLSPRLWEHCRDIGLETRGTSFPGSGNSTARSSSWVFGWWEFRDALVDEVRKHRNIHLYMGQEVSEIRQTENGGVLVRFRNKGGLPLRGDFLVAADGVQSKVRQLLNLPSLIESNVTNYRGSCHVKESSSPDLKALLEKGMVPLYAGTGKALYFVLFNFHTRHPGRLAWILATEVDTHDPNSPHTIHSIVRDHVKDSTTRDLIEEVLSLSEPDHLKPYKRSSIVDLSDETLASLKGGWGGVGLVTLVGDAAHGMRPTDGYGGSMALEDAVVLGRMLANKRSRNLSDALHDFERERLPRVKRVYDNQNERYVMRMEKGKSPGPQEEDFLDWLMAGV